MNDHLQIQTEIPASLIVPNGKDRFGEFHSLGISTVTFKITSQDSKDNFIVEINSHQKVGPWRHFHYKEDEWFYIVEGAYLFETGDNRFTLHPGDSLLIPKTLPHVWAYIGETRGRLLISFTPAGNMEEFFRETSKTNAMPGADPEFWHTYGMELLGPPLDV